MLQLLLVVLNTIFQVLLSRTRHRVCLLHRSLFFTCSVKSSSSWCFLWWSTFIQSSDSELLFWLNIICPYKSIFILYFDSSQVKSSALDQVYMVIVYNKLKSYYMTQFIEKYDSTFYQMNLIFCRYVYLHLILYDVIDDVYYTTSYLLPLWYMWLRLSSNDTKDR